jgi:hypothetical protein
VPKAARPELRGATLDPSQVSYEVELAAVGRKCLVGVSRINILIAVGMNGRSRPLFSGRHIFGGQTRIRTVKSTSTVGETATEATTHVTS